MAILININRNYQRFVVFMWEQFMFLTTLTIVDVYKTHLSLLGKNCDKKLDDFSLMNDCLSVGILFKSILWIKHFMIMKILFKFQDKTSNGKLVPFPNVLLETWLPLPKLILLFTTTMKNVAEINCVSIEFTFSSK